LPNAVDLDIEKFALSLEVFRPDGSPRPLEEAPPLRSLKGETVTNQEEMVRLPHDGSLRVREVSSAPIRNEDGSITGCVSIVRDITEKKSAEREHRLNEERLRRIVDILQHKCEGLQEFLDYALEQAIQLTLSKIGYIYHYDEEKKLFILNTWSKDVMPECSVRNPLNIYELDNTGYWGEAVRQRKPMVNNDFQASNPLKRGMPAGHVELKKFMTIPVFQDQRIIAVVGLANKELDYDEMDLLQTSLLMESIWKVVDRIKAENELRAVNEHLDQLVQQRTKELSNAMKEIESFSYTVSHDLRGPIRRMSSFCELIEQDSSNRFSAQGASYFERVKANIVQMNDLTEDILKLTKITRVEIRPEDIDLSDIALNCANDLKLENPERKCSFEIEPDMRVRADRELMILALSNLLENAWKYSASRENTRIGVGRIKEGAKAGAFFVKDNGIGFDPKFKDIIFQAFQRLNSEKEYPGSGIGLATVEKIISRHGGKIWAESVEGEGATFYFTF
jgi:signal transduction histidine kinase